MATTDDPGTGTPSLITHDATGAQRVPVNMYETDEALVVVAPMPGVTADDVEIVVDVDRLVLQAHVRATAPGKRYLLREWDYGGYERVLDLPGDFPGEVTASLGNGQLAISVGRTGDRAEGGRTVVRPAGTRT